MDINDSIYKSIKKLIFECSDTTEEQNLNNETFLSVTKLIERYARALKTISLKSINTLNEIHIKELISPFINTYDCKKLYLKEISFTKDGLYELM